MTLSQFFGQICKVLGVTYWNHNTADCGRMKYPKKASRSQKSYNISRNYESKKMNVLIQVQVTKSLRNSKKSSNASNKSPNDQSENSSDSEGSDSGEE